MSFKPTNKEDIRVIRSRENKWLHMLDHWDKYMLARYKKIRTRCRKGIPPAIRPRAWQHLCGAKYLSQQPARHGTFEGYLSQPGEQKWIDDIRKDLHRNFPNHELFGGIYEHIGQSELFKVLKAYSVYKPSDGYCQAQAPIAAALLMNMPAEEAFWCLVCICENYIPGNYNKLDFKLALACPRAEISHNKGSANKRACIHRLMFNFRLLCCRYGGHSIRRRRFVRPSQTSRSKRSQAPEKARHRTHPVHDRVVSLLVLPHFTLELRPPHLGHVFL